jgi:tetratricopeptide (TPR) repeat protein
VLIDMNRLGEAESLLRDALAINRETYGDLHFVVGQNLGNLLSLQLRTGALEAAEEAGREALAIHLATVGEGHSWVSLDLHNLGKVLHLQGRLDEALATLEQALSIGIAAQGEQHPQTAEIFFTLGRVHQARGELDSAESAFSRYLELRERTGILPVSVKGLTHLADVALARGRPEEAKALVARAFGEAGRLSDQYRWLLAFATSVSVEASAGSGPSEEVERQLLSSLEVLLASDSADVRYHQDGLLRMARVYERWGMPERAASYLAAAKSAQDEKRSSYDGPRQLEASHHQTTRPGS